MQKLFISLITLSLLFLSGCGNLSPRNDGRIAPRIGGKNNKIDKIESELKNMQGSMSAELGNVKAENKITAEKLENLQQGNFNKYNSGIQILQGDGVMVLILSLAGLAAACFVAFVYYRDRSQKTEKALDILAQKVIEADDPTLEDHIFEAAQHSGVAKQVIWALKKHV